MATVATPIAPDLPAPSPGGSAELSSGFPARQFAVLLGVGAVGVLSLTPYILFFLRTAPGVPTGGMRVMVLLFAIAMMLGMVAGAVALGLTAGPRAGLGAPLIAAALRSEVDEEELTRRLVIGATTGFALGAILVLLLVVVFLPVLPNLPFAEQARVPALRRLFGAFHSGIVEEMVLRLGMVSAVAWGVCAALPRWRHVRPVALGVAVLLVSVGFSLIQLSMAAAHMPVSGMLVFAVFSLAGLADLTYGVLYARYGIETAIVAHIVGAIVLNAIGPAIVIR